MARPIFMMSRRPFETWWAYTSYGQDNPLAVLGDRSDHLSGGVFRFLSQPDHPIACGGPLAQGQHETKDASVQICQLGLALSVGDEQLRELVMGHSQLDLEVAQKTYAGRGIPFRLFDLRPRGGGPLVHVDPPGPYQTMEARAYAFPISISLPSRQSFFLVWRMSPALAYRLQENERSNDVAITVCAFIRGKELVPCG